MMAAIWSCFLLFSIKVSYLITGGCFSLRIATITFDVNSFPGLNITRSELVLT